MTTDDLKAADLFVDAKPGHNAEDILDISPARDSKVLWKLDLMLMPLLGLCYMLTALDKSTLNYSTLLGLIADTGLQGSNYSWCSAIFYFGYLAWSIPTAYLSVRFPIGKYLATSVLLWSVVLMCHSACNNFTGLMIARFFLGVTEAAVAPGFSLLTGMFYTRSEQSFRHGLWFLGNPTAGIIGGVSAYAIGGIQSSLQTWRILFLIFGGITAFWAIVLLIFLPDNPATVMWLRKDEREIVAARTVQSTKTISKTTKFQWKQALEALQDPQSWCIVLYLFAVNVANGGVSAFSSLVLSGLGYTGRTALLYQMPLSACQAVFIIASSYLSSNMKSSRTIWMVLLNSISLVGAIMLFAPDKSHIATKYAGFCLVGAFGGNLPLLLSVSASNVLGISKKATVNGMIFLAYCTGNIVGPQFYITSQAPTYSSGIQSMVAGLAIGEFFLIALGCYYLFINRRRNQRTIPLEVPVTICTVVDGTDLTDWEIPSFRYIL